MKASASGLLMPIFALMVAAPERSQTSADPELSYLGRSSFKIRTAEGLVVYVDPYAPGDYSEPADLVLVSHGHGDHNAVSMVSMKGGCPIVAPAGAVPGRPVDAIAEGEERRFGSFEILALPAANKNHPRGFGVGYLFRFDGIVLYYSGDTSRLPEMEGWKGYGIDYALICSDGFYNMDAREAARCATLMGARRLVPIHTSKDGLFDEKTARSAPFPDLLVLAPGSLLRLKK